MEIPIYLAGNFVTSPQILTTKNPYDGSLVNTTYLATDAQVEEAITAAAQAFTDFSRSSTAERVAILEKVVQGIKDRQEKLANLICLESGKPIRDARGEVSRALHTWTTAGEEAKRLGGEIISLDHNASSLNRYGLIRRFPIGPVAAIAPFNFPFNLSSHKLAPALAAGCTIVLKPASANPSAVLLLGEIFEQAGLPKGVVSILPMTRETGDKLVTDERFKLLTFTGSPTVGWDMKARAGKKKVVLELGGNAAVIVDQDADIAQASARVAVGGFSYAGQSCISVQRLYVHQSQYELFKKELLARVQALVVDDPLLEETNVGPMIDESAAARTATWVEEAVEGGAKVLIGGSRVKNMFEPTVLEIVSEQAKLYREEAFAPLVILYSFTDFKEVVTRVNNSRFGLQCGVFTNNVVNLRYTWEHLEVGGVIHNDVSAYRIDHMPYGGIKDSGLGREGVKYAIEDMTEPRLLVLN